MELLSEPPDDMIDFASNTYILVCQEKTWELLFVDDENEMVPLELSLFEGLEKILSDKTLSELATEKKIRKIKKTLSKSNSAPHKSTITYSHQMLQGGIVHPDFSTVIPFMPEEICNTDGTTKQDCEMNAAKRFVKKTKEDYPQLGIVFGGDSLFSRQPLIEDILKQGDHYVFGAKMTDHKHIKQWLDTNPALCKKQYFDDQRNRTHSYEWFNGVSLNGQEDAVQVNFIRYKETSPTRKKPIYQNCWVTDLEITSDNIKTLVRAGRARWKSENECFNVLKNQGYNLEHSYGHGKENACFNFCLMIILAFFLHQIFELTDPKYQAVRKKFGSKKNMWEHLRIYITLMIFDSWEELLTFSLAPREHPLGQKLAQAHQAKRLSQAQLQQPP